jgi:trehalose 6-phosphate phosphatase
VTSGIAPSDALAHWDEIARRLAGARLALFLDYDGTLAPIAPTPELATLPETTREALVRAAARFPVAILSGRGREDVAAKVGLPGLVYAGSHGFDIAGENLRHEVGPEIPAAIKAAAARLAGDLSGIPGVRIEPKRFALSVHYRLAPEERLPEIERAVDAALAAHPALKKGLGKKLFELRPALDWDKGKALLWILDQWGLDRSAAEPNLPVLVPLYVGDDVTDEDAFQALRGHGLGIVVAQDGELPRETAAAYSLRDPDAVRELLERLAALPPTEETAAALRRSEERLRESEERYRSLVERPKGSG